MRSTRMPTTGDSKPYIADGLGLSLTSAFLSRGWAALLGVLAVPLYLRFLGVEAFGVVGIFTSLSAIFSVLDLGLGATLTRELSKLSGGTVLLSQARDTARTFELAYVAIAIAIGVIGSALAFPLGSDWVTVQSLSREEVSRALLLAAIALAVQWPGNLYTAGLAGLQRQVRLGIATISLATFRILLTLSVIWWDGSLQAFFAAQIAAAFIQSGALRGLFWFSLGSAEERPRFRWEIIRASRSFAGGMAAIAVTTVLQTQTDKVVLSRALDLTEFGVYAAVGVLASGIYLVVNPLFSVMYPRFCALIFQAKERQLAALYNEASQLIAVLVVPLAVVLTICGEEVLLLWTGDQELSAAGAWTFSLLIVGNACNGLVTMPYALQLASGWTRLVLWINSCSIVVLVPGVWLAATRFDAVGGAAAWALLNLGYLVLLPLIMHRRLLPNQAVYWYFTGVALPVLVCFGFGLIVLVPLALEEMSRIGFAGVLVGCWSAMVILLLFVLPDVRRSALAWWRSKGIG